MHKSEVFRDICVALGSIDDPERQRDVGGTLEGPGHQNGPDRMVRSDQTAPRLDESDVVSKSSKIDLKHLEIALKRFSTP